MKVLVIMVSFLISISALGETSSSLDQTCPPDMPVVIVHASDNISAKFSVMKCYQDSNGQTAKLAEPVNFIVEDILKLYNSLTDPIKQQDFVDRMRQVNIELDKLSVENVKSTEIELNATNVNAAKIVGVAIISAYYGGDSLKYMEAVGRFYQLKVLK